MMRDPDPHDPRVLSTQPEDVDQLIDRAREHPLGIDFLQKGMLDSVAAIFGVHAFVVDSARDKLRR